MNKCLFCENITQCPIHITDIQGEEVASSYLCEECGSLYFEKILASFINSCPDCGLTETEFENSGKFGCHHCYTYFRDQVERVVFPYHDAREHLGKAPKTPKNIEEKKKLLKLQFAKALELEQYEKADLIKKEIDLIS